MSTIVNARYKQKRGSEASIPSLLEGELYLPTNVRKIYKGTASGNICISDMETLDQLSSQITAFNQTISANSAKVNELYASYNYFMTGLDSNGIYTVVTVKRLDSTLYMDSTLSNLSGSNYGTLTERYYDTDGSTLKVTKVFTISYDSNGKISSIVEVS